MTSNTDTTPVSTAVTFSVAELELIADAFAAFFVSAPARRSEIIGFAHKHRELDLLWEGEEPVAEEDR